MIDVKSENGRVHVTIPTDGMSADQVNDFVTWLRVESVVRHSKLTEQAAWELSEGIKADWWERNKQRFGQ